MARCFKGRESLLCQMWQELLCRFIRFEINPMSNEIEPTAILMFILFVLSLLSILVAFGITQSGEIEKEESRWTWIDPSSRTFRDELQPSFNCVFYSWTVN